MNDVLGQSAREALGETGRRCTATNRAGNRCGRAPIPGGFVCAIHGGKIPAVAKTAHERLLAMVDPALDALLRFLRQLPPCKVCGRSDADRDPVVLRAAQLVLDRTGFHPTLALQQAETPRLPDYFAWIPRDRLEQMATWFAEAQLAMSRGEARAALPLPEAIQEGVLIDDDATA